MSRRNTTQLYAAFSTRAEFDAFAAEANSRRRYPRGGTESYVTTTPKLGSDGRIIVQLGKSISGFDAVTKISRTEAHDLLGIERTEPPTR